MKKLLLCFAVAAFGVTANSYGQFLTEDFEGSSVPSLPTGWSDVHTGGGNGWQTHSGGDYTILAAAGAVIPSHTTFAFVDDQIAHSNNPAKMSSSVFSMASSSSAAYVTFDAWFPQYRITSTGRAEIAWVEFSTDGGTTYSVVDSIRASGSDWTLKGMLLPTTTSATCKIRFCYSDKRPSSGADTIGIIGVGIDNIKIFNPPTNEIALTAVTPAVGDPSSDYKVIGGSFVFGGTVFNNGATTVTGFNAGFKVGSGTWVTGAVSGVSIAPFTSGTFTCTGSSTVSTVGQQTATVFVRATGDALFTNDSLATTVNGVTSFPTKRPFFEEPTGVWCGWCVRGIVYMDSIWHAYPNNVSVVSVHNGTSDAMRNDNASSVAYDNLAASKIAGFPGLIADRIFTQGDPSQVFTYYNSLSTWYGFADMKLTSSVSGGNISAIAKVTPTTNMSGDYRLELIITEDRVHGTTTGYDQHNYYNGGGSGAMQNSEYNFVTLPGTIPASTMYFDYVARTTLPANLATTPNGIAGSLPATMTAGTTYNYNFASVPVSSTWASNKLRGVALLIDNNSTSNTYNMVLNSVTTRWYVGVSDVKAGVQGLRVFPNPASDQAKVIFDLDNSANVSINVFDAMGRLVSTSTEQRAAGEQQATISVADLATGIYNVVIATENGSVSERLTVAK